MTLPRRWTRQIFKVLVAAGLLSGMVFVMDMYLNFLPTTVQTKLQLHQPNMVVTNVKIVSCFTVTGCANEIKDGWVQIPKDLALGSTWSKSYVYVKRVSEDLLEDDSKVVLDIALSSTKKHEIPLNVVEEIRGSKESADEEDMSVDMVEVKKQGWQNQGSLWIKYGKYNPHSSVTSAEVLYGSDAVDPRPGWSLRFGVLDPSLATIPRLSIRIGPKVPVAEKPKLKVQATHRFKIMQLADLHYSTGVGECRDPFPEESLPEDGSCEADPRTLQFIERALDIEKPDLVVLTGDQIYGDTSPDSLTSLLKVYDPLIQRKIPYAMVFGNHDHQGSLTREEQMQVISSLPYSLAESGPSDVDGVGNYVLTVAGPKTSHPVISLYFLDSHAGSVTPKVGGYDFIKENQLSFLQQEHRRLSEERSQSPLIQLGMAFFHIPLPEYRERSNPFVGEYREGCTAPHKNTHGRDVLASLGVSVVSVGHDHVNDFCMYHQKTQSNSTGDSIWLCHGGGVGEGGYGGYGGFIRRIRMFEVDTETGSISTHKLVRDNWGSQLDRQTLVNGGSLQPLSKD